MPKNINPWEHVFVAGQTGTGKTFLAEVYLAGYNHVVKLDTKGEVYERRAKGESAWYGLEEGKDFVVVERIAELDKQKIPKIIYAPVFEEQTQEHYNAVLKWVYERENTTIWIDELMSIADNPQRYPLYLRAIMTRGRSRNVSAWALTQRPMDIPSIVLSQTTHYFVFNMQLPQDRKKIAEATGVEEFNIKPGFRMFWYFRDGYETPIKATIKMK
jgi:DNA helicase HerA-like ATPase